MSEDAAPFEVLRFSASPVNGDVAVLELEGRFGNGTRANGDARLLLEAPGGDRIELPPVAGNAEDGRWRATFAAPADRVDGSAFALALRGLLLDLPDPDAADAEARHVALARELNTLRHRLDEAIATADVQAREARSAQASAYEQVKAAERRVAELEGELHNLGVERAADRRDAQATATSLQEALDAARSESRDLRRALKQARAEMEGLRREAEVERRRPREETPVRTGHVVAEAADAADTADEPETEVAHADEAPTAEAPRRGGTKTIAIEDLPAGEPIERVRVLGRDGRRATPEPPPAEAPIEPAPPVLGYLLAAAIFVVAIVVIMLLAL